MSDDPRIESAAKMLAATQLDGSCWPNYTDDAGVMLDALDAVDPLRAPATVCVRLDGLADKIAARLHQDRCDGSCLAGPARRDHQWAERLIELLQSLAVQ
jgi:hypothetical protein